MKLNDIVKHQGKDHVVVMVDRKDKTVGLISLDVYRTIDPITGKSTTPGQYSFAPEVVVAAASLR